MADYDSANGILWMGGYVEKGKEFGLAAITKSWGVILLYVSDTDP